MGREKKKEGAKRKKQRDGGCEKRMGRNYRYERKETVTGKKNSHQENNRKL